MKGKFGRLLAVECGSCGGTGIVPPRRPGDWPTACPCAGLPFVSIGELADLLEVRPSALLEVDELRATASDAAHVLQRLWDRGLLGRTVLRRSEER